METIVEGNSRRAKTMFSQKVGGMHGFFIPTYGARSDFYYSFNAQTLQF